MPDRLMIANASPPPDTGSRQKDSIMSLGRTTQSSRRIPIGLGIIASALFAVPLLIGDQYWLSTLSISWIWAILALSIALLLGCGGLLSIAHGALFGMGAYTVALLTVDASWNFWGALIAAIVICAVMGAALGFITKNLAGHYFTIATLAFGVAATAFVEAVPNLTHGSLGVSPVPPPPGPPGIADNVESWLYILTVISLVLVLILCHIVRRSGFGRAFQATRDNRILAESLGISLRTVRMYAFGISGAIAAISGGLYSSWAVYVSPADTSFLVGFEAAIYAVIGGIELLIGPAIGAVAGYLLPEVLRVADDYRLGIFGVLLILVVIFVPNGLAGLARSFATTIQRRPSQGTSDNDGKTGE